MGSQQRVPDSLHGPFPFYVAIGATHAGVAAGAEFLTQMNWQTAFDRPWDSTSMAVAPFLYTAAEANVIYVVEVDLNTTTQFVLGLKVRNVGTVAGTQTIRLGGIGFDTGDLM